MNHYCVYTRDITQEIIQDLTQYNILFETHLNRTRLWLSGSDPDHVLFYLKWSTVLHSVDHEQDHVLGI